MTVLTLVLCTAFIRLGHWQWDRGEQRQRQLLEFQAGTTDAMPLGSQSLASVARFQRVRITGRYDVQRQFLLDNLTHDGRAGYQVLTPMELADGRRILVNRGWVPFSGYRDRLPIISFRPQEPVTLTGRVEELPSPGLAQGKTSPDSDGSWPKVTSYPTTEDLAHALGHPVEPRSVLLDADQPDGYVRDWHAPGLTPEKHWSYAVQWWSFAAVLFILWAALSTRRAPEAS